MNSLMGFIYTGLIANVLSKLNEDDYENDFEKYNSIENLAYVLADESIRKGFGIELLRINQNLDKLILLNYDVNCASM